MNKTSIQSEQIRAGNFSEKSPTIFVLTHMVLEFIPLLPGMVDKGSAVGCEPGAVFTEDP